MVVYLDYFLQMFAIALAWCLAVATTAGLLVVVFKAWVWWTAQGGPFRGRGR